MTAILIDLSVKTAILIAAAGLVTAVMRAASAASRHAVWTAAFVAVLLLPVGKLTLPALPIFVLSPAPLDTIPPPVVMTAAVPTEPVQPIAVATTTDISAPMVPVAAAPPAPRWSVSGVLTVVWLVGVSAILMKAAVGIARARRLAHQAQPVEDSTITARLLSVVQTFGVRRTIRLLIASRNWMPVTWGVVRPTIVLPSCAETWRDDHGDRLDLVLVHEVAHIARWDALSQLVARVVLAMHWFNPLVWLAVRQARLERERACDDAVLARGFRPSDYASDLLVMAESLTSPASSGALAMARPSQLDRRITSILDVRMNRKGISRTSRLLAVAIVLAMLPVAAAKLTARQLPKAVVVEANWVSTADVQPPAPQVKTPAPQASQTPKPTPTPVRAHVATDPAQRQKWQKAREEMILQLLDRARTHVQQARLRKQIGTSQPMDVAELEKTVATIERALNPVGGTTIRFEGAPPNDDGIAATKANFAKALKDLDAAETRFNNGLLGPSQLSFSTMQALLVVIGQSALNEAVSTDSAPRGTAIGADALTSNLKGSHAFVFGEHTPTKNIWSVAETDPKRMKIMAALMSESGVSDYELIAALKQAAALTGEDDMRAEVLLALAQRYRFTPEMVTLYVDAANGIKSEAERNRVFAQAVRIKPAGGK